MNLEVKTVPGHENARIIAFDGDLDSTNVESTLEQVNDIYDSGVTHIIADFQKLRYVNSTGLGILLHISKTARNNSCSFKIAKINDNVFEIIEIIGANTLLEVYAEIQDAIDAIS